MPPLFDDLAVIQNKDLIGVTHGTETVGDHHHGAATAEGAKAFDDDPLVARIQCTSCFVEEQKIRVLVDRPGD